jgi:uncharacterized damage-inducible protein DinB
MATETKEFWLSGPVDGVPDALLPFAQALLQARQDLESLLANLPRELLWVRPGGAASVGFHVLHLAGALDRLYTYARGETLSAAQKEALTLERGDSSLDGDLLMERVSQAIGAALQQLRRTDAATLMDDRRVGKAQLPTTVLGLLYHGAEHCTRHVGQIVTTLKILRGTPAHA